MALRSSNSIFDRLSYNDACLCMIGCHLLDMLSTDIVLYHGSGSAVEVNSIAASTHGGWPVILFRLASIILTYASLRISKLNSNELAYLSKFSWLDIAIYSKINIGFYTKLKVGIIITFGMISITRLFVSISNFSGELFGLSATIFVEKFLGINSLNSIGIITVALLSLMSLFAICVLWTSFRQKGISD